MVDLPLLVAPDAPPVLETWHDGVPVPLRFRAAIAVNNREAARRMAAAGMGAAQVLQAAADEDVSAGRLVRLIPDRDVGEILFDLVLRDTLPSPEARRFVTLLDGAD